MNKSSLIEYIYDKMNVGDFAPAFDNRQKLNDYIIFLLNKDKLTRGEIEDLEKCIIIGNLSYENTASDLLPIDSGVWDLMVEKYRKYTDNDSYPIGAKPVSLTQPDIEEFNSKSKRLFVQVSEEEKNQKENMLFPEIINKDKIMTYLDFPKKQLFVQDQYISKRYHSIAHEHPDLVGTFDKCKFVLTSQAQDRGVLGDANVRVMERDFFFPLLERGILNYNDEFTMLATLKYDGVSVEADVTDRILSARSRGDTGMGVAIDMTPILGGYQFPRVTDDIIKGGPIGVKFEAIVNKYNLLKLNQLKGYNYKNCRTAIIGIMGSSDGYLYRDLITLVPISTDVGSGKDPVDRLAEVEFINDYYTRDQYLRYSVLSGTYVQILFQIKRFVEEAEFSRSYLPFMYDGVVFEFLDESIRNKLGRDNYIDRYKCAIKFTPLRKQTIFRGYKYTIGQDGSITPMIYYDPVEFFGTIHPKSSGHSYKRFTELDLHIGDIIDVEYVNDVMPYVSKPDNKFNRENKLLNPHNELSSFPTNCPSCGTPIVISPSGKSAYCTNMNCPERCVQRMSSTMQKIGIVDFGEQTVRTLGYKHLSDFYSDNAVPEKDFAVLGENDSINLFNQLYKLRHVPMHDSKALGALGFTNIGEKTWKLILSNVSLKSLMELYLSGNLIPERIPYIKGIGDITKETIVSEFSFFENDLLFIMSKMQLIETKIGSAESPIGKQIRFTGFRDKQLEDKLSKLGHDVDGNAGVTKKTDILLVPYHGYAHGNKVKKAMKYGIKIVPVKNFTDYIDQYL